MPAGLASVTQQLQVFFTVTLAACFLRDLRDLRQGIGLGIALAGLALIGLTTGADLKPRGTRPRNGRGFQLARREYTRQAYERRANLPVDVWASLVPPILALLVSPLYDQHSLLAAIANASWPSIATVVYLGTLVTPVAQGIWGYLLQRYPTAVVAPFALLSPCAGALAAALLFGEVFVRASGTALILVGLATVLLPTGRLWCFGRRPH